MDRCDNCNHYSDLYHNEATGLSFCEACDLLFQGGEPNMRGTWRQVLGLQNLWLIRTDVPNPADHIHMADTDPSPVFKGYGGSELRFETEHGTLSLKGPWHSNSKALLKDTGLDLTNLHLTQVTITTADGGTIYDEDKPALGPFDRGDIVAEALSTALACGPVRVLCQSNGGSMSRVVGG
jgi:hypothetical protein